MSDMNNKTNACSKNNELVAVNTREEPISENLWIIGVSKTHPGLKYYFNTVTGVSLWNISNEDMKRAKHTMKSHQSQSLYYINCPEPKDPPPGKSVFSNKSNQTYYRQDEHAKNCSKQYSNSGLVRDTPGFTCDTCCGSVNPPRNVITVNFRPCPHPTCNSQSDDACSAHSQIQSTSTLIESTISQNCSNKLLGSTMSHNRSNAETTVNDLSNEHLQDQSNADSDFLNHSIGHKETLDLTPLKLFAENGTIKDKWYIITDADVYLNHIKLLMSVVNSDNKCCLMVPSNVKIELENATKFGPRTKAHYASYFIYKMFDCGLAIIDEDRSDHIEDKSNEEHILESFSNLKEQNFYVIVISNDIELQKYRNKIYKPIFTVAEVKEYLYKTSYSDISKSPEPKFNFSHTSKNINVSTTNNPCNKIPNIHGTHMKTNPYVITKQNLNIQPSEVFHDIGTQVEGNVSKTADAEVQTKFYSTQLENINKQGQPDQHNNDFKRRKGHLTSNILLCEPVITNQDVTVTSNKNMQTPEVFHDVGTQIDVSEKADVEVQTNFFPRKVEEIEHVSKDIGQPNFNDDIVRKKDLFVSNNQLSESLQHNSISCVSKRIKLKRRKMFNQTTQKLSTKLDDRSENHIDNSNATSTLPSDDNLLLNKKLEERNKKITITYEDPAADESTTSHTLRQKIKENDLIPNETKLKQCIVQSTPHKGTVENKNNVMFEVTTDMMHDNLRTRCDEWVSRFVQIMEEALTQVLRKKSSLHLPPPWNMYEATVCIERLFHNDEDVADASNKFSNVLNRICDKKGNINSNISPAQYMEMYSFGVYLIDALQGIFSSCEDLQTAAESLSKLLNDIQDPETYMKNIELHLPSENHLINDTESNDNVEVLMIVETESENTENTEYVPNETETVTSTNALLKDSSETLKNLSQFKITFSNNECSNNYVVNAFKNHSFSAMNIKTSEKSLEDSNNTCIETQNAYNTDAVTSPSRYNLRSKRILSSEQIDRESLPKENKIIKNDKFKGMFLSNFLLQKNILKNKQHTQNNSFADKITTEDVSNNVDSSGHLEKNVECSYEFKRPTELSNRITTDEPKIVRNFVICSEIENRLRTRRIHDEMEELDFEDELMAADYLDEVSSGGTGRLQIDEFPEYNDSVDGYRHVEQEITKRAEYVNINFIQFVRRIAEEIKELSSEVYTFSQNSYEVLNSLASSDDKKCIREKGEQAHFCIDKICTALAKIMNRDKNAWYNVQELLKNTEFHDISIDDDQLEAYGSFIARCLEHARNLKNTIENILSAVC